MIQHTRPPLPAVRTLLEDTDPRRRAEAHLVLGKRAIARDDVTAAAVHFREAADLDPGDDRARALLRATATAPEPRRRLWGLWGR